MMTSRNPTAELSEQVRIKHEMLRAPLIEMCRAAEDLTEQEENPSKLEAVVAAIDAVRDNAEQHFEAETNLGFYENLSALLPNDAKLLEALQLEHATLRSMLERCEAIARCCRPAEFHLLRARLELFLQLLHLHEATEDLLMQRAIDEETKQA